MTVDERAWAVNSFDVLLGMHNAGLKNFVLLPSGGVLIHMVLYERMDMIMRLEFGEPTKEVGIKYLN